MSKLEFANTGPQLAHIIKDHPRWTAIAEATRNMIEAATAYHGDNKPIQLKIRKLDINSGLIEYEEPNGKIIDRFKNKLSFLNPGGMDAGELGVAFCQIGSSVNKTNSLDHNYGQGIRTATLFWTDLLCITYKDGVGHFVWLGKKDLQGNNFEIEIKSEAGRWLMQECTDWIKDNAQNREYNLDEDFTEVIFLGQGANPTQDTYLDPYGEGKLHPAGHAWIRKALYTRFWSVPKNVEILLHLNVLGSDVAKNQSGYKPFMTFEQCLNWDVPKAVEKPKREIVKSQNTGARIQYFHDVQLPEDETGKEGYKKPTPYSAFKANDNGGGNVNVSCILLGREMYDVKDNPASEQSTLIKLGIHGDFRNFKIVYELPQNAGYTYDMYRTSVLSGQDPVDFDDENILIDIIDHMPGWFKALVAKTKLRNKLDLNDEINRRLAAQRSLLNPFRGMTTNGKGSIKGQKNGGGNSTPSQKSTSKKNKIRNTNGPRFGTPVIPPIIPNPTVTEPYFAKVEGTLVQSTVFTNPNWKQLENLAVQLDQSITGGDGGRWYVRAKQLLEDEFTISAVIWYLNAFSEHTQKNISSDEYQDTIKAKSIDMYLKAIQTGIFDLVGDQLRREFKLESKEIKASNVNEDVVTNESTAWEPSQRVEGYREPIKQ